MGRAFTMQIKVRYGECDPQGVVFNANYLGYFDVVLTEAWTEATGRPYMDMIEYQGTDLVVAEANLRFLGPARFDEMIDAEWRITRLGTTAMITRIDLSANGEPVVEGEMRHVFIDPETKQKKPMPDEIRTALEPYAAQPAADSRQPARQ
jgi:acyl-CoA thioester hydrolase